MDARNVTEALSAALNGPPPISIKEVSPLISQFVNLQPIVEVLAELEKRLQIIYKTEVDHTSPEQIECFIETLYALRSVLSPSSIISIWSVLVLLPSLKNPRLPTAAVQQAKELLSLGFHDEGRKVEVRKRILDHYLLDSVSEASGEDAIEAVRMNEEERERRRMWKNNLQDVLLFEAEVNPVDFLDLLNSTFATPSARLQLSVLIAGLLRRERISARALMSTPLIETILTSLLVDNSTTLFEIETTIIKLTLPLLAIHESEKLKELLPKLLAVIGRHLCWSRRSQSKAQESQNDEGDLLGLVQVDLDVDPQLNWSCLESVFDTAVSPPPPDITQYFTFIYGLWPCNTISFLRNPLEYLVSRNVPCPFTVGWENVFDIDKIRLGSRILICSHAVHPSALFRDADAELADPTPWFAASSNNTSEIVAECMALDFRQKASSSTRRINFKEASSSRSPSPASPASKASDSPFIDSSRPSTSIVQNIVATNIALKSGVDPTEFLEDPASPNLLPYISPNPTILTPLALPSPIAFASNRSTSALATGTSTSRDLTPLQAAHEVIAALQRELLLSRNELSFELWTKKKLVDHVQVLHRDRISTKKEEAERQNLRNKLKEYKTELTHIRAQLKAHRVESESARVKFNAWIKELQVKLQNLRTEKQSWLKEAVELRSEVLEAKRVVDAQKNVLADAQKTLFSLTAFQKENLPKIDRINQYQRRIGELVKIQALWEDSEEVRTFKEQRVKADHVLGRFKHMELLVGSLENENKGLQNMIGQQKDLIQSLEARLLALSSRGTSPGGSAPPSPTSARKARRFHSPYQHEQQSSSDGTAKASKFQKENSELRKKNVDLHEEVEELKAMVEILRSEKERWQFPQTTNRKRLSTGPFANITGNMMGGPSPLLSPIALADLAGAQTEPSDVFSLPK